MGERCEGRRTEMGQGVMRFLPATFLTDALAPLAPPYEGEAKGKIRLGLPLPAEKMMILNRAGRRSESHVERIGIVAHSLQIS